MRYLRTILALLLTAFCGAGAGIFLTFSEESLLGTFLYAAFPLAVGVLFVAIGMDVLRDMRRVEKPQPEVLQPAKKQAPVEHHPQAA
jgi:hypothetical protein